MSRFLFGSDREQDESNSWIDLLSNSDARMSKMQLLCPEFPLRFTCNNGKVDSEGLSKPLTSPSRPWPRLPAELGSRQTPPPQTLSRLSALASPTPQRKMDRMSPARERAQGSKKGLHSPCTQQPRRQRLHLPRYSALLKHCYMHC